LFFQVICNIEISGTTQGQGHLQRIFITDLETISSIKEIWKINLEQDKVYRQKVEPPKLLINAAFTRTI